MATSKSSEAQKNHEWEYKQRNLKGIYYRIYIDMVEKSQNPSHVFSYFQILIMALFCNVLLISIKFCQQFPVYL